MREEKGAVAIIIAILLVVLFGFAALVIDVGALYEERRQNQTGADAAALAGAQELPMNPTSAKAVAIDYASENGRTIAEDNIEITKTYVDNDTIRVFVQTQVNFIFARVLGYDSSSVPATATAIVGSPTTFGGTKLMPWARMDEPFEFGKEYVLFRSTDPSTGNFQAIQLPYINPDDGSTESFSGAVDYFDLVAGQNNQGQPIVPADVQLHQILKTFTGNFGVNTRNALNIRIDTDTHIFSDVVQAGPTGDYDSILDYDCPRLIVIVTVVNPNGTYNYHSDDSLIWPTGTSSPVEVEKFNYFFISDYVSKPSEGDYVTGIFVRTLTPEEAKLGAYDPSSGMRIVKLIR